MEKMMMRVKTFLTGVALCAASFSVSAGDFLTADQLKAAVSGKTLIWEHMLKSKSGKSYYAADGTAMGISNGKDREGTWKVEGNELCISWGKCMPMEADGKGGFYKVKGGSKRVLHIKSVEEGNTVK